MDIDLAAPGLQRIVEPHPPLDRIAYGLTFGEGPVWDRRNKQLYWVDIIGNTIWKWKPGVGREVVLKPSGHANGMTFDREGRLVVAGWCTRTIFRFEKDSAITTVASRYQGKKFNSPNDIVVKSDGSIYWTLGMMVGSFRCGDRFLGHAVAILRSAAPESSVERQAPVKCKPFPLRYRQARTNPPYGTP